MPCVHPQDLATWTKRTSNPIHVDLDSLRLSIPPQVYLKLEFSQFTGSFKERGARNALMCLSPVSNQSSGRRAGMLGAASFSFPALSAVFAVL